MNNEFYPKLDELPAQLLWSAFKLWQRHRKASLQELDLTLAQFITLASLFWLSKRDINVTQVILAQRSKVDIMHTSRIVRMLEKKGLITRVPSPEDSRANYLTITPKGEVLVLKGVKDVEISNNKFFASIKDKEKEFVAIMKVLIQANDLPEGGEK